MPVNVGTLVIDLVAGTASFSASMDKMSALSAKTANDISRSLMKISVAGVAAVTAITGALTAMVKGALDSVDALAKASQSAGTTAETLSTLQYAASLSNVEAESLTMALEKLSKAELAAATGNVELERAFKKIGVTASDGNGHLKDSGVLYEQLAQKFAAMPDGAVKTALAIQLFGKAGAQQIPLLNQLGADLAGVQKEAQQFGLVVGTDVAELSAKAHDNLDRLHQVLKGIGYSILGAVLPAMDGMLERLIDTAKQADIPGLAKSFGKNVADAVVMLGNALAFAAKHATALKVALEALAAIQVSRILLPIAADIAAGGWAKLGDGVARFATNLFGLQKVIPTLGKLWTWATDGVKFIALLVSEEGLASAATYVLGGAFTLMGGWVGVAVAAVASLGAGLFALRDHFFQLGDTTYKVRDIWNAAWIAMGKLLDNIKSIFSSVITWIKNEWKKFIDWLGINSIVKPVMDGINSMLGSIGRVLGAHMPGWLKDSLDQAKREREAAEKAAAATTTTTKKTPAAAQPTVEGLGKPEKDPYKETIEKLDLAIRTQVAYIGVLDGTPDAIARVIAAEKAKAIILEQNIKLQEKGKPLLDDNQKRQITARVAMEESLKSVDDFGKSLVKQRQESALAADAADALAAAQLRGVDAVRQAQVENEINAMILGKTTAQLGVTKEQLEALRKQLLDTMNRKAVDDLSIAIDQQKDKLDLEARSALIMADAWGRGDAAVAAARIQVELLGMELGKSAGEIALLRAHADDLAAALKGVADAQQAVQAAENLKALQDQAREQEILTGAIFGTLDAQRQAEVQAKTIAIDRAIAAATDAKVIAALEAERDQIIANTKAEQARKDTEAALALRDPAEIYEREREALQKQVDALAKANGGMLTYNEQLGIAAKNQDLLNKALDDEISRLLKVGSAADGVRAFFLEMQKHAITAAQVMYDALNSTIDKLSDNLANLMTGQKANWAQMLKDIGHQMAQESIKGLLQKGLGALGSKLGINLQKRDGQSADTAWYVQIAGGGPATPGGASGGLGGILGGGGEGDEGDGGGFLSGDFAVPDASSLGALGKILGVFGKFAGAFGGAFAGGGEVEPGSAYLVGERGPELYTPGATGNIHTADETGRMLTTGGGAVHLYTIDARGTDPALTEQRTRAAIIAAHQSAVLTSGQVQMERTARTPPMPRR